MVFAIHWHESVMGIPVSPHPKRPSHPPHTISLGSSSAPVLSALFHASKLDWSSISYMVIYIFQCYSLKSSHPHLLPPEKAMAPHSSTLAWEIPWMEGPGGLESMGSWRVGHDWATSLLLFTFMHWRRKWQPTPVFLPGESQGRGSLVGCRLWGRTESDMTEAT